MSRELSNAELVERCLRGDESAWHQLVKRYARLVHSVPVRHGLTPVEVDDVGQEVFLVLAQNLHQVDDPERLAGWLVTTARRLSWRALQKRNREQPGPDADVADAPHADAAASLFTAVPTVEELFAAWSRQEILYQALERLNDRCHELLHLLFLDRAEPSYEQISERLQIPTGSIGPTRSRCLNQLRSILEGLGFTPKQ